MPSATMFAALDTTLGFIGLMVFIVVLVLAIAIYVAVQVAEEHLDNLDQRQR